MAPSATAISLEVLASATGDRVVNANFSVTAGVAVHLTVINRDLEATGAPEPYAQAWGNLVGPVQTHWADPVGSPAGLSPAEVSHTFTVDLPGALSVPIPAASPEFGPSWVSFTVYFNSTGTYHWYCASFCDDIPGGDGTPMGGTITVLA